MKIVYFIASFFVISGCKTLSDYKSNELIEHIYEERNSKIFFSKDKLHFCVFAPDIKDDEVACLYFGEKNGYRNLGNPESINHRLIQKGK